MHAKGAAVLSLLSWRIVVSRKVRHALKGNDRNVIVQSTPAVRAILLAAAVCGLAASGAAGKSPPPAGDGAERVGRQADGRTVLPVNQVVTPLGRQVELPGMRPQALALSPDGRLLAISGKTAEVVILDPATGAVRQRVAIRTGSATSTPGAAISRIIEPRAKGQVSYTGLIFSPDGARLFLSNVDGDLKVFDVAPEGTVNAARSIPLPSANAPRRKQEIPSGLACSADGRRIYVCGNLSNTLLELDAASGRMLRTWEVGVAPYDVVLVGGRAYVSNWGGRRPGPGDLTGPAGRGTVVRVDPQRRIACEGSVTAIELATGRKTEIITGLHASALAVSPGGKYVVCANAAADNLSVIDVATDAVVETIWVKPAPSDLLGASPNALAFAPDGRTLYVANGTQNAIAVVRFKPEGKESKLLGLLPVGWFPGALVYDAARRQLCIANIKGHQSQPAAARPDAATAGTHGFNSLQFHGSVSLVPLPAPDDLPRLSQMVWDNLRRERIRAALLPPRPGQPPRAVPERIGEPSLIRHVVYIIKENRTYDQVLGDMAAGNGDPRLCIFGERVTPNQHKLAREFVLLDNTYCAGILSADGHQWCTTAFGTDYLEKSFAGWPRSYPDGMGIDAVDALAYSPAGFLWDRALQHRVSLRNYGEFTRPCFRWKDPKRRGEPQFLDCYRAWKKGGGDVHFECAACIETLRPYSPTGYVGWGLAVPDQYRADFILRELREYERRGEFPQLVLICLPNDHTSGANRRCPTPAASVADNDLALGRIVEGLSRSKFWRQMAILAIEDDPQNGWDHVSGYRTTAYVASPYARRKAVVSTQYNTTSLLRTMEQILGLPPMNQFDASAEPLRDCFTDTPDLAPYAALPNNVPLDQMNGDPQSLGDPQLRADALASERMNFNEVDRAPEDALNRILWRAQRGTAAPYPEWAVQPVADDDERDGDKGRKRD
jgi:YVTN family beta-propeller protein